MLLMVTIVTYHLDFQSSPAIYPFPEMGMAKSLLQVRSGLSFALHRR